MYGFSAFGINIRHDLKVVLEQGICQQPQFLGAWLQEQQIFDAGVMASLHRPVVNGKDLAFSYAKKRNHEGVAWGVCPNQSVWVVTTPAPASLKKVDLVRWCSRLSWDVALMNGEVRKAVRHGPPFEEGVTGVYCWKKTFENQGPVLWYLIEKNKQNIDFSNFDKQGSSRSVWLRWVNSLRRQQGVSPVSLETAEWMDSLFHPGRLYHDHQALLALDAELKKVSRYRILGENRVSGGDLNALMQQMWSSPRHRKLLLAPRAKKMALKQVSDFAVLVMLGDDF